MVFNAPNGKLSYFLQSIANERGDNINFIATDSGERIDRGMISSFNDINVENINFKDAIKKYEPGIIIESWMPLGEDFTPYFRNNEYCQTYYIIGQEENGCCGSDDTFNCALFNSDGFKMVVLEDLSRFQIGRAFNLNYPLLKLGDVDDEYDLYKKDKGTYLENIQDLYYSKTIKFYK